MTNHNVFIYYKHTPAKNTTTLLLHIYYTQNFSMLYLGIYFYTIYNVWNIPPFETFNKSI